MSEPRTILRYSAPERINHWVVAFCFVLAAISGLGLLFPSLNWLMSIFGPTTGSHHAPVYRCVYVCGI